MTADQLQAQAAALLAARDPRWEAGMMDAQERGVGGFGFVGHGTQGAVGTAAARHEPRHLVGEGARPRRADHGAAGAGSAGAGMSDERIERNGKVYVPLSSDGAMLAVLALAALGAVTALYWIGSGIAWLIRTLQACS